MGRRRIGGEWTKPFIVCCVQGNPILNFFHGEGRGFGRCWSVCYICCRCLESDCAYLWLYSLTFPLSLIHPLSDESAKYEDDLAKQGGVCKCVCEVYASVLSVGPLKQVFSFLDYNLCGWPRAVRAFHQQQNLVNNPDRVSEFSPTPTVKYISKYLVRRPSHDGCVQ